MTSFRNWIWIGSWKWMGVILSFVALAPGMCSAEPVSRHYGTMPDSGKQVDLELVLAIMDGNVANVRALIKRGANVDASFDQYTFLCIAVGGQRPDIVAELIVAGADVNKVSKGPGKGPLHVAVDYGGIRVVKLLVERGSKIDAVDKTGGTPLQNAVFFGMGDIVEYLISKGASVNSKTRAGESPLHTAAWGGDANMVRLLVNKGARTGIPICDAVILGEVKGVEGLLNRDAKLVSEADSFGWRPIHWAGALGKKEMLSLLLGKGAEVNGWSKSEVRKFCPLHIVCASGNTEAAELLLKKGAEVNNKTGDGCTPLRLAAERGRIEICSLLAASGADVNAKDLWGLAPLHVASRFGSQEIVRLLLSKGADVNAKDNVGKTPLLMAVFRKRQAIAQILLDNKGDPNSPDEIGNTPLRVAEDLKDAGMVELLTKHGAKR